MLITARPSLGSTRPGLTENGTKASRMSIWAMASSCGLVLRTCSSMSPGFSTVRSKTSASMGAAG
jgi:hypothetical protein